MEGTNYEVSPGKLRLAMRRWASGVTVVSSQYGADRHGMTVSSFTSVSLEPPLVLVSLEIGKRTHRLVKQSGVYAVSILGQSHQRISDLFAGRETDSEDRFADLETYTLRSGAPLLLDSLAGFDCEVVAAHDAGTHTLFIGKVTAVQLGPGGPPLLYYNRAYRRLA